MKYLLKYANFIKFFYVNKKKRMTAGGILLFDYDYVITF